MTYHRGIPGKYYRYTGIYYYSKKKKYIHVIFVLFRSVMIGSKESCFRNVLINILNIQRRMLYQAGVVHRDINK